MNYGLNKIKQEYIKLCSDNFSLVTFFFSLLMLSVCLGLQSGLQAFPEPHCSWAAEAVRCLRGSDSARLVSAIHLQDGRPSSAPSGGASRGHELYPPHDSWDPRWLRPSYSGGQSQGGIRGRGSWGGRLWLHALMIQENRESAGSGFLYVVCTLCPPSYSLSIIKRAHSALWVVAGSTGRRQELCLGFSCTSSCVGV